MRDVKIGTAIAIIACSGAAISDDAIQVGTEWEKHYINLSHDDDSGKADHKLMGVSAHYERSDKEALFGLDARTLMGRRKDNVRSAHIMEGKAYLGFNFSNDYESAILTPYSGIGAKRFRVSTLEEGESEKISQKAFYVPIGVKASFEVGNIIVKPIIEYDVLINGQTKMCGTSELFKTPATYSQKLKGFGAKASIEVNFGDISITPFAHFWKYRAKSVTYKTAGHRFDGNIKSKMRHTEIGVRVGFNF